jgi:hypothetical protein
LFDDVHRNKLVTSLFCCLFDINISVYLENIISQRNDLLGDLFLRGSVLRRNI